MKRNMWVGGGLLVACAAVAVGMLTGSTSDRAAFAEALKKPGQRCEVYGKLEAETIHSIHGANQVRFLLVDEKTNQRMDVLYDNPTVGLPANFPAASHAKCVGEYDATQQKFIADAVMTKCPSKYDAGSLSDVNRQRIEKWQRATGQVDKT
jgi:cytochrome c-type biogenesis protein CcmE